MEFFIELIPTLGFPIVAVIALAAFVWRIYKKSEEREEAFQKQIKEYARVNAQAIEALAIFSERLAVIETDVKDIKNIIQEDK